MKEFFTVEECLKQYWCLYLVPTLKLKKNETNSLRHDDNVSFTDVKKGNVCLPTMDTGGDHRNERLRMYSSLFM